MSNDKLTFFKFSPSDWMMGRIKKLSWEAQGKFISLICMYWNNECELSIIDAELEVGEEQLMQYIKYKIVKKSGENIVINFLDRNMEAILEKSESASKSANLRWERIRKAKQKQSEPNANASKSHANASDTQRNKDRDKEGDKDKKKNTIPFDDFWELYDKKLDRKQCVPKWNKLKESDKEKIMTYLPSYIKSTPDKQYRKNPATFLNNRSWENEIITKDNGKEEAPKITFPREPQMR